MSRKVIDDYFEDRRYDDFFSFYEGVMEKRSELSKPTMDKYLLCLATLKEFCIVFENLKYDEGVNEKDFFTPKIRVCILE